jgi:tetratricopeptide (TPR) repeat protein
LRFGCTGCAVLLCVSAAIGPLATATVHAQMEPAAGSSAPEPDAAAPPQIAVDHYLRGRRWYLAGRYRDALIELKAALEYDRDSADLLYNIARVYENLSEFDEAIAFYQRYLSRLPMGAVEERDRTNKTIGRLQGAKLEISTQSTKPPPTRSIGRADFAFWLTASGGAALLAAGGVTGWFALKKTDKVAAFVVGSDDGPFSKREKLASDAKRLALVADGLFIGGAAALTGAALLFFLRDPETKHAQPKVGFGLGLDATHAQLSVHGAF